MFEQFQTHHMRNMEMRMSHMLRGYARSLNVPVNFSPNDNHNLSSLMLANLPETSCELYFFGFQRDATAIERHNIIATEWAPYPEKDDPDMQPKGSFSETSPGINVYNAQEKMSSYEIIFKSSGARKKAQRHFTRNKQNPIKCRTRAPCYQETIDQQLISARNAPQEQGLRINFQDKYIYRSDGSYYAAWSWDNAAVMPAGIDTR